MIFLSRDELLLLQGTPRALIRGRRAPIFMPWKTRGRLPGNITFISTSSDLSVWHPSDIEMLHSVQRVRVRLQRPGTLTQDELMNLPDDPQFYWLDIFATAPDAQGQLLETWLGLIPPVNDFVM